jgi:tripartite-type tricarboxylate transporter receptor subunit TctC
MNASRRAFLAGAAALSAAVVASSSRAEAPAYPRRPVKIIVPYAAGGGTDIMARLIGAAMEPDIGGSLVIENRSGGASIPGTQAVAAAAPDGYTIGMVDSAFVSNPALFRHQKLPYDTKGDFKPVALLARNHMVLVVLASSPITSAQDLVARIRANPGKLTFASAGIGTAIHLAGEQLRQTQKLDFTTIPYRGGGPAMTDILAGEVTFAFHSYSVVREYIDSGRMRALGVAGSRLVQAPAIPALAELGLPDIDAANDLGFIAPAATPDAIVDKLAASSSNAVKTGLRERIITLGATPLGGTPGEYRAYIDQEIDKWTRLMVAGNIKAE